MTFIWIAASTVDALLPVTKIHPKLFDELGSGAGESTTKDNRFEYRGVAETDTSQGPAEVQSTEFGCATMVTCSYSPPYPMHIRSIDQDLPRKSGAKKSNRERAIGGQFAVLGV